MNYPERIILRITSDTLDHLKNEALYAGVTISEYLRQLIAKDMDEKTNEF